jgi:membrane associated rhomboid family serine protease
VFPLKDNIPSLRFPVITVALIVLNLAVFVWQLTLSGDPGSTEGKLAGVASVSERDAAAIQLGAIPYRITHPARECDLVGQPSTGASGIFCQGTPEAEQAEADPGIVAKVIDAVPWWLTVITSMFLHAGVLHFAGNMLFLWVFGNSVEGSMGRGRFLAFYLLSGAVAVYAQAAFNVDATGPTIGASGAVAGVLGAYALLYPRARILTFVLVIFFFTFVEIPAMILLGVWFLLQFLPAVGQLATPDVAGQGGIAYLAHVGGFVFGLVAIKLFANRVTEVEPEARYPVY